MDSPLFYEDIEVAQIWVSPRRTVTEADVISFATMTGDFNPLHVDYDFASRSHYRQPIAHGLLGLSWVAGLGSYFPSVNTLAFVAVRNWEFMRPLYFGDTVYVETTCISKEPTGRRTGKIVWNRKLWNQRGEIVQQGIFETLVAIKSPTERHALPKESATDYGGAPSANMLGSSNGSSGLKSIARSTEPR
jgi:acyl dehydratase